MKRLTNYSVAGQDQQRGSRRGATMVESAIVLSTFAAILLGVLDLGLAVLRQNSLDAAARQVARAAIVRGDMASRGPAWGPVRQATRASGASEIAETARGALITINPQDVIVVVDWPEGDNRPEQRLRVRLAYRHKSMFSMLYGPHLDLRSECVMRIAH